MMYQVESPYGKAESGMNQAISTYGKRFRKKPKAKQNPAANIKSVVDAAKGAYKLKDLYNKWGADGVGDIDAWSRDNVSNRTDVETPLESMSGGGGDGVVDMSQEGLAWSRPETALSGGPANPEAIATPAVTPGTPGGMPPTPAMPMAAPETAAAEVAQMAAPETAMMGAPVEAAAPAVATEMAEVAAGAEIAGGAAGAEIAGAAAAAGAAEAGAVTMGVAGAAIPAAEAAALASTVGAETAIAAGSMAGPVGLIAGGLVAGIGSFLFS